MPGTTAILVGAGRGIRAGGGLAKQWRALGQKTVAAHTIDRFLSHPCIDDVILVLSAEAVASDVWARHPRVTAVAGGADRAASVRAGLNAVPDDRDHVLIHDLARPLISDEVIHRVVAALADAPGAAPGVAVVDALWTGGDYVTGTQSRDGLFRAQTPQGFQLSAIRAAHAAFEGAAADDVEVARAAGIQVAIVAGDEDNLKITRPEDFSRAERLLGGNMDLRVGHGYDVHRFGEGDHVTLCGIAVPFNRGLQGHSDADVGMHALTDAIYGALADGDIGRHFPPSDPQWKGAASHIFLEHAGARATARGFRIQNADVTLVCELPKIGPHSVEMQHKLAEILGLEDGRISVKATTSERLGFTGRGEGIAAMATVLLVAG